MQRNDCCIRGFNSLRQLQILKKDQIVVTLVNLIHIAARLIKLLHPEINASQHRLHSQSNIRSSSLRRIMAPKRSQHIR
jgi:hypothetical protein